MKSWPGAAKTGAGRGRAGGSEEDDVLGKVYDGRLVRRLLPFLVPQASLIAVSVLLMFVVTGAQLLQPWLVKLLIDEHIVKGTARGAGTLVLLYALASIVELAARYGQLYAMERTGQNVIFDLRRRVFAHFQRLDAAYFDRNPVGRLMTRVTTDVESLADLFSSGVVSLLGDTVKLVAIVVLLLWLDVRLALATFAVVPALFLLSVGFRGRIRRSYREARRRIARINAYLQEAVSGMLLLQLFRREAESRREFDVINRDHREAEQRSVVYESGFSAVIEMIGTLASALIVWQGGGLILGGVLSFGTLVAFLDYTARFFAPIRDLSGFYAVFQAAMASLERLFALLDVRPTIVDAPEARRLPAARGAITFDAVRFAYLPGEEVLHGVSFQVEPGETVAIVGATGSGKSTIAKLLLRLYDPTGGAVRLDGVDLRSLALADLRRQVGIVPQDHFLWSGTIAANIAFEDGADAEARAAEAARLARADPFIARLPRGYREPVRERGGNLSTGQKQLLSFARALAHDPRVLVLDEATSSVDSETESLVQEALGRLRAGRTALIIAHRLSTIADADRILVLHHGRLVEEGRHEELMRRDGVYAHLCRLQFGLEDEAEGRPADDGKADDASVAESRTAAGRQEPSTGF